MQLKGCRGGVQIQFKGQQDKSMQLWSLIFKGTAHIRCKQLPFHHLFQFRSLQKYYANIPRAIFNRCMSSSLYKCFYSTETQVSAFLNIFWLKHRSTGWLICKCWEMDKLVEHFSVFLPTEEHNLRWLFHVDFFGDITVAFVAGVFCYIFV